MKKRMFALLLVLILAVSLAIPAAAYEDHYYVYTAISAIDNERLVEQGETTLPFVSEQAQFDLRVDIVDDLEGDTIDEYAELFYRQYEYGWGDEKDGALLMIYLEDNGDSVNFADYTIYAGGKGGEVLNGTGAEGMYQMLDLILTGSNVDYVQAGEICADAIDSYMGLMITLLNPVDETMPIGEEEPVAEAPAEEDINVPAAEGEGPLGVPTPTVSQYILDEAALLSEGQVLLLEGQAQTLADRYGCGVYVLTVPTMNGMEVREFAQDYYLSHQLGVGEYSNGILFLVCMDTRDYITITYGRNPDKITEYGIGILAFTDTGIAQLEDKVVGHLSDGNYNKAFSVYLDVCEEYLSYYDENGQGMEAVSAKSFLIKLAIVICAPLLVALVVCMIFRSQMKTARIAKQAANYIPQDSFNLTERLDQYTHTSRTRRKIETNKSSGGSSVNSAGFGGSRGGKF